MAAPRDDVKKRMMDMQKRFYQGGAGPTGPVPTKPRPNQVPSRNQTGVGPVRPAARVQSSYKATEAPKFVSYETNPELSSKQAGIINAARAKGYQERLTGEQEARGTLDNVYQSGLNARQTTLQAGANQRSVQSMIQEGLSGRQQNEFAQRLTERGLNRADKLTDMKTTRGQAIRDQAVSSAMELYKKTGDPSMLAEVMKGYNEFGVDGPEFNPSDIGAKSFNPTGSFAQQRVGGSSDEPVYANVDTRTGSPVDPQVAAWLQQYRKRALGIEDDEQ